jgi:uncharacterized membrane protein YkvA (DUF1232 family)
MTMNRQSILGRTKRWAKSLKRDVLALWLAARDPRVPWYAKALCAAVAAYALSPIDLIPDFVPVLGYLDDLILLPLGIMLAIRLIPAELMAEFRMMAERQAERPSGKWAAIAIIVLWLAASAMLLWICWPASAD